MTLLIHHDVEGLLAAIGLLLSIDTLRRKVSNRHEPELCGLAGKDDFRAKFIGLVRTGFSRSLRRFIGLGPALFYQRSQQLNTQHRTSRQSIVKTACVEEFVTSDTWQADKV